MSDAKRLLEPCVESAWARNAQGYGSGTFRSVKWRAHRLAWTLEHGPIPFGMVVMHLCDNPPCINLNHLRLGTQAENVADCAAKGRRSQMRHGAKGEANSHSRLTETDVRAIRVRRGEGEGVRALGRAYSIDPTQITRITRRERWAHVE